MEEILSQQKAFYSRMLEVERPLVELRVKNTLATRIRLIAFCVGMICALFFIPFIIFYLSNISPPMYTTVPVIVGAVCVLFLLVTSTIPTFKIRHSKGFKNLYEYRRDFWNDISEFAKLNYGFEIPPDPGIPAPCETIQGMKVFFTDRDLMRKAMVEVVDERIIFFCGGEEMEPIDVKEERERSKVQERDASIRKYIDGLLPETVPESTAESVALSPGAGLLRTTKESFTINPRWHAFKNKIPFTRVVKTTPEPVNTEDALTDDEPISHDDRM